MANWKLKQSTAACPDACGATPSVSWTCESRNGTASLCGFSKYQNFNAGDWNGRKLRTVATIGSGEICCQKTPCTTTGFCSSGTAGDFYNITRSFSGCTSPNPTEQCGTTNYFGFSGDACGTGTSGTDTYPCIGQDIDNPPTFARNPAGDCAGNSTLAYVVTITDTTKSVSGTNTCVDDEACGALRFKAFGTVTESLSDPDTIYNAIGREVSFTSGVGCRTGATSISSTASKSRTAISFTAFSVRDSFSCAGLTVSTSYTVRITVSRYDAFTAGSILDTQTVDVSFTASGSTYSFDYDLPVDDTGFYEVTSAAFI